MWELNRNDGIRNEEDNRRKSIIKDQDNGNVKGISGERVKIMKGINLLKTYREFSVEDREFYEEMLSSLEPESSLKMIEKTIKIGIPYAFVEKYYSDSIKDFDNTSLKDVDKMKIKRGILREYLKDVLLFVTSDSEEVKLVENLCNEQEIRFIWIKDVESLVVKMEENSMEGVGMTLWLSSTLPADVEESMEVIKDHLELPDVFNIEVGSSYFEGSLKFNNWEELTNNSFVEKELSVDREEILGNLRRELKGINEENTYSDYEDGYENKNKIKNNTEDEEDKSSDSIDINNNKAKEVIEASKTKAQETLYEGNKEELGKFKELYRKSKKDLEKLENVIAKKDKEIEKHIREIEKFKEIEEEINEISGDLTERDEKLKRLTLDNKHLKNEIDKITEDYRNLEIEFLANSDILNDKVNELADRDKEYEDLKEEYEQLQLEIQETLEKMPDLGELERLQNLVSDYEVDFESKERLVKQLQVDKSKISKEKDMISKELEELKASYKDLLSKGEIIAEDLDVKELKDDMKSHVFYFKMYNQPHYFSTFIKSLQGTLKGEKNKILTVIIRELDEITDIYYKGIKRINILEEQTITSDDVVWLKPSKLMFEDDDDFYNKYDYIIVLDYIKAKKVYMKGSKLTLVYTVMNDKERKLLDVKGSTLSGGDTSIIDMKYDKKLDEAKTSFIRDKLMEVKVKKWLDSVGMM